MICPISRVWEVDAKMKRQIIPIIGILIGIAGTVPAQERSMSEVLPSNPPVARTEAEKKILAVMDHMMQFHQTYLSVPPKDGEALWLLAEAANARTVVEIGTSTGYSGLWFCLALEKTGGHLTTFELDHERATMARGHFQDAGVENLVTIVEGDAHHQVMTLKTPIDLAFIDADKPGYVDYLEKLLPLVRPGGLILAHNVEMVPDYVKAVTTNADLATIFYMQGNGLAVTLKKR
jgi:caffeoyl-CoA O-methyltransferase